MVSECLQEELRFPHLEFQNDEMLADENLKVKLALSYILPLNIKETK